MQKWREMEKQRVREEKSSCGVDQRKSWLRIGLSTCEEGVAYDISVNLLSLKVLKGGI